MRRFLAAAGLLGLSLWLASTINLTGPKESRAQYYPENIYAEGFRATSADSVEFTFPQQICWWRVVYAGGQADTQFDIVFTYTDDSTYRATFLYAPFYAEGVFERNRPCLKKIKFVLRQGTLDIAFYGAY